MPSSFEKHRFSRTERSQPQYVERSPLPPSGLSSFEHVNIGLDDDFRRTFGHLPYPPYSQHYADRAGMPLYSQEPMHQPLQHDQGYELSSRLSDVPAHDFPYAQISLSEIPGPSSSEVPQQQPSSSHRAAKPGGRGRRAKHPPLEVTSPGGTAYKQHDQSHTEFTLTLSIKGREVDPRLVSNARGDGTDIPITGGGGGVYANVTPGAQERREKKRERDRVGYRERYRERYRVRRAESSEEE
jgi:hypothetical protein